MAHGQHGASIEAVTRFCRPDARAQLRDGRVKQAAGEERLRRVISCRSAGRLVRCSESLGCTWAARQEMLRARAADGPANRQAPALSQGWG